MFTAVWNNTIPYEIVRILFNTKRVFLWLVIEIFIVIAKYPGMQQCFIFMLVMWAQVIPLKIKKQNIFNKYKVYCLFKSDVFRGGWLGAWVD